MRLLLINGSPKGKKSNTYQLTQAFLEGLMPEEVRERCVRDLELKPCIGCFACWNRTPGKCCQQDDMEWVLEDMLWADVILWSFPLYYFSVPGPLKILLDRQLPLVLPFMRSDAESGGHDARYDMTGKRYVVISTCGFYRAEGNYGGVDAMFEHLCGKGNYTSIYCGQGELFRVKELRDRTQSYLGDVRQAGKEFAQGTISRETREKLDTLLFPREVFEAMADASWGLEPTGEKAGEDLTFTRQMAALYRPEAWQGKDLVLEMVYTDIGKRYQLVLMKDGHQVMTEHFRQPTTTIETSYALWKSIAAGEISGEQALMEGRYRVLGDFNLMIQWDRYFGSDAPEASRTEESKTSMLNLMSWAALWMLLGVHPLYGPLGVIAACAILPLVLFKTRKTIYDVLSSALVPVLACCALMGMKVDTVMQMSFFCFGLMWAVSCLRRLPLSAWYVVNQYGDAMMENPLFLRTNRIICAGWGGLYLLIPTVHLLLGSSVASVFQAVGSAAMGIFTVWFQKWYPAYVARGGKNREEQ